MHYNLFFSSLNRIRNSWSGINRVICESFWWSSPGSLQSASSSSMPCIFLIIQALDRYMLTEIVLEMLKISVVMRIWLWLFSEVSKCFSVEKCEWSVAIVCFVCLFFSSWYIASISLVVFLWCASSPRTLYVLQDRNDLFTESETDYLQNTHSL